MPKIRVLDKQVAELIAAGEVVERPASVIKELVENSIDAKASSITLEIQRGGVSFIRITDNGCGINKEDVPTAFLRHATSKVQNEDDLDCISSLGFRGEALASISAVARVELLTKTADEEIGTRIVINGGEIESIEDAGCPNGTTIVVRDIFYNIPARMKFLKKDVGEGNAVANIIDKIALSHPEISFRFIRDKKETLYTSGDGKLSSAIYGVFGKDFLKGLIPIDYTYENIKVTGYISEPKSTRPNRNMQNFFINGRFIKSKTTMFAMEEAYKGMVMTGKFPACVMHIEMSFSMLDVNVHPAKLEVRFVNEKPIFSAVYHSVKSALLQNDKPKEFVFKPKTNIFEEKPKVYEQTKLSTPKPIVVENFTGLLSDSKEEKAKPLEFVTKEQEIMDYVPKPEPKIPVFTKEEPKFEPEIEMPKIEPYVSKPLPIFEEKPVLEIKKIEKRIEVQVEEKPQEKIVEKVYTDHKIIGEAFKTYIIIEYNDKLVYIDKHAAHERLLYEKIKKDSTAYAQVLLSPVTVTLDKKSHLAVLENTEKLSKAGFEVEDFGASSIIVRTAPLSLVGQDIVSSIIEISGYLLQNKSSLETEHLEWIYSNVACRAAIKGGKQSSEEEMIALARRLEENPEIKYCPHGRPVYLVMKKYDIEKQFGRIQ